VNEEERTQGEKRKWEGAKKRDNVFYGGWKELLAFKVHRQYPLVLLINVD
jgi:hypothetical protein